MQELRTKYASTELSSEGNWTIKKPLKFNLSDWEFVSDYTGNSMEQRWIGQHAIKLVKM